MMSWFNLWELPSCLSSISFFFSVLTLCGSKSCLTVKLSTTQEARLCSTQARNITTRAKIWKSILDANANPAKVSLLENVIYPVLLKKIISIACAECNSMVKVSAGPCKAASAYLKFRVKLQEVFSAELLQLSEAW